MCARQPLKSSVNRCVLVRCVPKNLRVGDVYGSSKSLHIAFSYIWTDFCSPCDDYPSSLFRKSEYHLSLDISGSGFCVYNIMYSGNGNVLRSIWPQIHTHTCIYIYMYKIIVGPQKVCVLFHTGLCPPTENSKEGPRTNCIA